VKVFRVILFQEAAVMHLVCKERYVDAKKGMLMHRLARYPWQAMEADKDSDSMRTFSKINNLQTSY